jgi:hypothetical protein
MNTTTPSDYNATAVKFDADENFLGVEAVQTSAGQVLRACGLWSPENGTLAFEAIWLSYQAPGGTIEVIPDGGAYYEVRLRTLNLPEPVRWHFVTDAGGEPEEALEAWLENEFETGGMDEWAPELRADPTGLDCFERYEGVTE